ncbi:MAG: recombinase family protein [Mucilaginibacter sp.]|uniref:recombinase family protein n=1 Tax=Mucilaginibacter sp. TaxID=1882438 RepID=UPI0032677B95
MMKKACLYIRVSTDEQADKGFSQRDQHERLLDYCAKNAITPEKIIFEDYSAKTFNRPEWSRMLTELKRSKGAAYDYILFTKWDRFSRNTADAYQMMRTLKELSTDPMAIEQPLDLTVPESKTILAVYLSMPEVDNDRRALNVMYGMRRGKKEGRWMGIALPGYANKCTEDGRKYIAPIEPEASHMKWAFEMIAKGTYATEHVWMLAKEKGLKCKRTSFWTAVRNPCYCGKVIVPAFKDEEEYLAQGVHEPLVSEQVFYAVQDVIDGRKRLFKPKGIKAVTPDEFPLRGFLGCPVCGYMLTGSGSKGRRFHYYYYHCKKNKCRQRHGVDKTNKLFEEELKRFVPKPGMADIFEDVIMDTYSDQSKFYKEERKRVNSLVSEHKERLKKSRELLLKDALTSEEYKEIKAETDAHIVRCEADLKNLQERVSHGLDITSMANDSRSNLESIYNQYVTADNAGKRHIIGAIYKEGWVFDGQEHRTGKINEAALLIYHINNKLQHKKTGVKTSKSSYSGTVPSAGVEPARFPTGV